MRRGQSDKIWGGVRLVENWEIHVHRIPNYIRLNELGGDRTPKILSHHPYHLFIHVVKGDTRTQGDIMIKIAGGNVKMPSQDIAKYQLSSTYIYSALNRRKGCL